MADVAVLIETDETGIKPANFGIMTKAQEAGADAVWGLVFDANPEDIKADAESYGIAKIVGLGGGAPDTKAAALAAAVTNFGFSALLGLSSSRGRDLLARAACLIDAPLALDCTDIDFKNASVAKSHFSGKTTVTLRLVGQPLVCGLRPNVFEPVQHPVQAEVIAYEPGGTNPGRMSVREMQKASSGKVDLTEAEIIITGGRPIGSADNFAILDQCAQVMGAAVGASRAAVDAGFAPHSMQVGQTGKTVSPKLYIGCGLSGSVQHFAGMKTSKVIVGVNTDKDAPIFGKCNYGIVGDLFEVVPVLTDVLKSVKD